jgi:putative Mg2+ transporter-C (MgtC) family protein
MLDILIREIAGGMPDPAAAARVTLRLLVAALLGAIVGIERERTGKAAGLRTHMLVSMSCALFVLAPLDAGMSQTDVSRVIQGVAAGIGFLGAGAILKLDAEHEIHGLTTAAGIFMTAAVGVAAGLGRLGLAAIAVALGWIILAIMGRVEVRNDRPRS